MSKNEIKLSERVRERLARDFPAERKLTEFSELADPRSVPMMVECDREDLEEILLGVTWNEINREGLERVSFILSLISVESFALFLPGFLFTAAEYLEEGDGDILEMVLDCFLFMDGANEEFLREPIGGLTRGQMTAQQRVAVDEALSIIENASLDYELMDVEKLPGLMQVVQARLRAVV